jgi:hypothetical protein
MKTCSKCKVEKDFSQFNKNKAAKDGLSYQCKTCIKGTMTVYYQNNKQAFVDRAIKANEEIVNFVRELKNNPCMDCGNKFHFSAMDFDHRDADEKVMSIAKLVSWGNKQKVIDEIAKCDLVCSNCHRVRTWKRRVGAWSAGSL